MHKLKTFRYFAIALFCLVLLAWKQSIGPGPERISIPASVQRQGNADAGVRYIITGDYVNSGIPLGFYRLGFGKDKNNWLGRDSLNATVRYDFNVVKAPNGRDIVVPNCLQCHAQVFEGQLIIGLGNVNGDFTRPKVSPKLMTGALETFLSLDKGNRDASSHFLTVAKTIGEKTLTDVVGVNPADRLTAVLIAHRNKQTLAWQDSASVELPSTVIPSDVPAWWMLKKKNAMFYNGFGRGDFGRFLMGAILLTINDTIHAHEVDGHMPDVLAYLNSLNPPKFPKPLNHTLVDQGKVVFETHCSKCHGFYGDNGNYPNYLIPQEIIGTDSLLNKSNYQFSDMISWFNTSWFAQGDHPAKLEPFNGYIAPPLDGVWITAPYLHNGSIPNLEALLDSRLRPNYWSRDIQKPVYDYQKLGWSYREEKGPGDKNTYNTNLPGYGNYGHNFGDKLSKEERTAILEYLKTL